MSYYRICQLWQRTVARYANDKLSLPASKVNEMNTGSYELIGVPNEK